LEVAVEIPNPKLEIRNKFKIRIGNVQNLPAEVLEHLDFELLICFASPFLGRTQKGYNFLSAL
jgi:hypothetical protein